jgi:tetratricopeptide (TPR) repeat protein
MKNKRIVVQALIAKSLPLAAMVAVANCNPGWAVDPADDAGVFGSITVAKQAREGVKALKTGDYPAALIAYRSAIGLNHGVKEFYYGLLFAGQKVENWDQVTVALDNIAEQDPAAKQHLSYEYGNCYTKIGRYDEALPLLKAALRSPADGDFLTGKIKELVAMTAAPAPPVVKTPKQIEREKEIEDARKRAAAPPPPYVAIPGSDLNVDSRPIGSDYESAFLKSEWIGICEYRGYEKKENILFNNPPTAQFYWTKCLKGPPLNHDMPVKFKFYEYDGQPKPAGWKFSEDKMPKKGSKWLIFIPNAVVVPGGFDTYRGSYGRQEATEDNLGTIYAIIEAHHGQ